MSLMLGSVSTTPSWHGLWLRLIEDTTPARGALASALATRTGYKRVKTKCIYEWLCKYSERRKIATICELGFSMRQAIARSLLPGSRCVR